MTWAMIPLSPLMNKESLRDEILMFLESVRQDTLCSLCVTLILSFPCLRAEALQRAGVETGIQVKDVDSCLRRNDKNGEVSRTGIHWSGYPPYRLQLKVAKKRIVVNGLKQMRVEKRFYTTRYFLTISSFFQISSMIP